jgi:hypothetical protein
MAIESSPPSVRTYRAKLAGSRSARLDKSAPLAENEGVLFESEVMAKAAGSRVGHLGYVRLTDRRLLVSVGQMPFLDRVTEVPRGLLHVESVMATQGLAGPKRKAVAVRYRTDAGDAELLLWGWEKVPGAEYRQAGAAQRIAAMMEHRTQELLEALSRPL